MATFQFAYNIGDIVSFISSVKDGQVLMSRGVINSILISGNEALYMIQTRYAQHPVAETDIVKPIFSTKSFDVFYPGVEVYVRLKDTSEEVTAYVDSAVISNGRLRYWLTDSSGLHTFQAEEGCVRLANTSHDNVNHFH